MKHQNKLSEMRQKIKQTLFPKKQSLISNQFTKETEGKKSLSNQQLKINSGSKEKRAKTTIQYSFHDYYETSDIIGQGTNGLVKICYKKSQSSQLLNFGHIPTKYAVKIIPNADDPELINTIIRTFNINRSLNCIPSVIQAMDLFIDEQEEVSYWVMEYCEWNSLEYYMNRNMNEKQVMEIMRQLAITLQSIHNKGICHRDIKPDNILIKFGEQIEIKVIDFGVSKKYFKKNKDGKIIHEMWTRTGTILYQAPEIFLCGIYNEKIDLWSCGIILFQLLCHQFPFLSETIIDTIEQITSPLQNPWRVSKFVQLNRTQQDLLKRLLNKIPERRLSAEEFLLHPLFSSHSIKQDYFRDDTQLTVRKEKRQRDFKIATALQLSDLFNPCKINSPMYLNPVQNNGSIGKDTQQINNHIYYHQKNCVNFQYKVSDFRMKSKQNFSGKSSFLFITNSRENSPPISSQIFDQLDETNEEEQSWTRKGFRQLDQQMKRKFSK